jgi:L-fuconolactonase
MPRIDAHQHFWRYSPQTHGWIDDNMAVLKRDFLPEHLAPLLRERTYDGCVAVQAEQAVSETRWLLSLADQHAFIKGVVGWVDLRDPDVATVLAELARHPRFRGVRHIVQGEPDDRFMLGAEFQRGIAALAPLGLTYDILIYPRQLPAAIDLVQRFPQQPFVLDHIAKPDMKAGTREPWAAQLRALAAAHPTLTCKLSGLVTEADWASWKVTDIHPFLDTVLEAFGTQRLMIGSDWPVCTLAADYHRTMGLVEEYLARVPPAAREAILGGTAAAFYGLT